MPMPINSNSAPVFLVITPKKANKKDRLISTMIFCGANSRFKICLFAGRNFRIVHSILLEPGANISGEMSFLSFMLLLPVLYVSGASAKVLQKHFRAASVAPASFLEEVKR